MNSMVIEYFGYAASVIVAVSLMMSSIVKLRWYNLIGASFFSAYGFFIGSMPVFVLNGFIAAADVYYLVRLYRTTEHFSLLEPTYDSAYVHAFLNFYKTDIKRIFPDFTFDLKGCHVYLILRDAVPAGIFVGSVEGKRMKIDLDYATPKYRDLKLALYMFRECTDVFTDKGIEMLEADPHSPVHEKYLQKMGFSRSEENGKARYEYRLPAAVE